MTKDEVDALAAKISTAIVSGGLISMRFAKHLPALIASKLSESPWLQDGRDSNEKCGDCAGPLIFSARDLNTGLCHYCAHKRYVAIKAIVSKQE